MPTKQGGRVNETHFWSLVELGGPDGCWDWLGTIRPDGYPYYGGRPAYRVCRELLRGVAPKGLHLDHLCRNKRCINPDHLEPVTQAENNRRRAMAQTHCKRGHEFSEENTYRWTDRDGYRIRICRTCRKGRTS